MAVIGTTLMMPIADAPAVFVGGKLASKIPMKLVHAIAAAISALRGLRHGSGPGRSSGSKAEETHAIGEFCPSRWRFLPLLIPYPPMLYEAFEHEPHHP